MNMKKWKDDILAAPEKKALPILSFPCVQLLGITVQQLISDSSMQAQGMKKICERVDSLASLAMMDLSVEAEAFGSVIHKSDNEVPVVIGRIIETLDDAEKLAIPDACVGRTSLYISTIGKAAGLITDRPVLAGVIGPFSLAGRLMDMSEIMFACYDNPEMVHVILGKVSEFITNYILEFKKEGASGVIMAEPAAGLLSPNQIEVFSSSYIRTVVNQVKDDNFLFVYHNCGLNKVKFLPSVIGIGADACHFGNSIDMPQVLAEMPSDMLVLGNISPSSEFRNGTPQSIYTAATELLRKCSGYGNFIISSGCDIPPLSPWSNIDSFFRAVGDFYRCGGI
ncbi:MAG: uroporphyrinogen decarboxylase family protein [Treponema sp.]|nr:uroporphyrinogen decarboxylase family protein [Treponema sp.]